MFDRVNRLLRGAASNWRLLCEAGRSNCGCGLRLQRLRRGNVLVQRLRLRKRRLLVCHCGLAELVQERGARGSSVPLPRCPRRAALPERHGRDADADARADACCGKYELGFANELRPTCWLDTARKWLYFRVVFARSIPGTTSRGAESSRNSSIDTLLACEVSRQAVPARIGHVEELKQEGEQSCQGYVRLSG